LSAAKPIRGSASWKGEDGLSAAKPILRGPSCGGQYAPASAQARMSCAKAACVPGAGVRHFMNAE